MNKIKYDVPFFQSPNSIFEADDLRIYDKIVYLYLCRCGNNAKAFPSYNTIAKKCGMSRRKAIDCIENLLSKGYLKKRTRQNSLINYSNVYEVIFK